MKGTILDEYVRKRNGREFHLIDIMGQTGAPHYNHFVASHRGPEHDRFVTCIFTHDEPDAEPERHTVVFWGKVAHAAKRLLMDSPRVAAIKLTGGRVDDPYPGQDGVFRSSISINWPDQINVLDFWDYEQNKSFEDVLKDLDNLS